MAKEENSLDKITLWMIEDNNHYRRTIFKLINQSTEYACRFAFSSCEEAFIKLNQEAPPEIILLDIGLQGMNGIEGIKVLKKISPSTQIIVLTIHDDDNSVFEALYYGASGYLLKDSPPEGILEAIKEVRSGGAPMNSQIARKVIDRFKQLNPPQGNYGLTEREKEILSLLIDGLNKSQIAEKLFISFHTVNTHIKNIYEKLHVHSRSGVISKAFKEKLI
ncbi:MAG TPA: response regulator transcription factor [Ignavibacteriaceae bacterium]|nr:response regulator transcription factor [Ignavibacteriaceae bacterium]